MKRAHAWILIAFPFLLQEGAALAQVVPKAFLSFDEFREHVKESRFEDYSARKGGGIKQRLEFRKMRQHILSLYEGVEVRHSFLMDEQYFDCVPVLQQPAVRKLGLDKVELEPRDPLPTEAPGGATANDEIHAVPSPTTVGLKDSFGNEIACEAGTIPMRRVTLEEVSRFGTLERFFQKIPLDEGSPRGDLKSAPPVVHKYAHAAQNVKNYGGNSWLNLWSPAINTASGQIFSLSQHWYVGGRGKNLQTVEGGWQAYPEKYKTPKSVVFIYWTADNYNKTGCYNLDCAAFVQTNSNWLLGGTWTNYSTHGGTQWAFQMQWRLTGGKWWLFLQGDGAYEAVGYYPVSIYKRGQLSKNATVIDYGGETVGAASWPPMGSGSFASQGPSQAAYQSLIFYNAGTGTTDTKWGNLGASQPSPKCYTLKLTPSSSGGSSGTYFYYGGPGGGSC